ncbi:signal peptidase I [Candidatus Bathyarchaeota archaeon]|nr:signal peptidase I [Candidatus Bathyarchaeota archaeon]
MKLPDAIKKDYVQTVIMIAIVVFAVLLFWYGLSFVLKTGNPVLAVASGSMEPVLYKGDLIVIEGIENPANIKVGIKDSIVPGDIIVFNEPGISEELIVHRAVEKIDNGDGSYSFKTWGDNNGFKDGWTVEENDIVGRYLDIKIPWLGNIALYFASFEVKVAFIALWIVVIVIVEVAPSIKRKIKSNKDEESLYK